MAKAKPPRGGSGGSGPSEPGRRRSPLQALFYWTLVLGIWGAANYLKQSPLPEIEPEAPKAP